MVNAAAAAAAAWSPSASQVSCWASEWSVAGPVRSGRYTLTARSSSGSTRMATGSLRSCAPAGITTDVLPPNVTGRTWPSTAADPGSRGSASATVTRPTRKGVVPKTFVSSRRIGSPPALAKMTSRTVWSSKPRAASVPGPAACGLALQLVIQPSAPDRAAAAGREAAMMVRLTATTSRAAAAGSARRISRDAFRLAGLMGVSSLRSPASDETPLSAVGL